MLPKLLTSIPGPESKKWLNRLRASECNHITYSDKSFPIFIEKSKDSNVWDVDQNRLLDFTSFFGVSSLGHNQTKLRTILQHASKEGWHSMGDVHPHVAKVRAAEAILSILPTSLNRVFFSSSGSEAVETALKTACLISGNSKVIYFEGSYHGLGYGALQVTDRDHFRKPFLDDTIHTGTCLPFIEEGASVEHIYESIKRIEKILKKPKGPSTVILELIQGRGGVRKADFKWVQLLRKVTKQQNAILIIDEIYTGFGRTGTNFAFEKYKIIPDVICLGKAMANGFPISACVMGKVGDQAWGKSTGEAKHTSTFLGHPLGCEMVVEVIRQLLLPESKQQRLQHSFYLDQSLHELKDARPVQIIKIAGEGFMRGVVFHEQKKAVLISKKLLQAGILTLPSGRDSNVLSLSPSFYVTKKEINHLQHTILQLI